MGDNSYSQSVLPSGMGLRKSRFTPHILTQQDPFSEMAQTENASKFKAVYEGAAKKGKAGPQGDGKDKKIHEGPYSGLLQENPRAMTWDRDIGVLLGQGKSKNMIKAYWPDTGTMKMTYKVSSKSGLPNLRSVPQSRALLRVLERQGIDTKDRDYVALHERVYHRKRTATDEPEGFRGTDQENYHKTEDATKMYDEKKEQREKAKYYITEDETIEEKKTADDHKKGKNKKTKDKKAKPKTGTM